MSGSEICSTQDSFPTNAENTSGPETRPEDLDAGGLPDSVSRALAALAAERERTGEPIAGQSINRIAAACKLSPSEWLALTEAVTAAGLDAHDTDESVQADEGSPDANGPTERPSDLVDQMARHPLLTGQEEIDLGRCIRGARSFAAALAEGQIEPSEQVASVLARGREAERIFVLSNVRLVLDIAHAYVGRGVELDDLVQEGLIGTMKAVVMFDPSLGFKFSTYATWWIRQAISRAIGNTGRAIRLPVHAGEDLNRLRRVVRKLSIDGRRPTARQVADRLGWTLEKTGRMLVLESERFIAMESEGDEPSILDLLPSDGLNPAQYMEEVDLKRLLRRCLSALPPRTASILRRRFGLVRTQSAETLENVGRSFNLTRERIRQIEERSLTKLHLKHHEELRPYLEGDT
ncbi:MAG: sigma-70 family RNA polymerase sigma factor [Rhodanobacteraceae bacterium]|nr:sigma-70 family RNA polymerase sigma factor [Rhodanobacteraceae bacterium]